MIITKKQILKNNINLMDIIKEIFEYIFKRKKYWLLPIILILLIFSTLIFLTQGTAIAPFIYTIF